MKRLPLTVVGGYLGAGKTTLINALLTQAPLTNAKGKRLLVMVNDFGAINIDADLLLSRGEDMIALSNGCVCCTMGGDLFMALGAVLDKDVWPDHIVIEASGIADPSKIANVAQTEAQLEYRGIVTVVDGLNIEGLLADPQIGEQVQTQIDVADLLFVSKAQTQSLMRQLASTANAPILTDINQIIDLMIAEFVPTEFSPKPVLNSSHTAHPDYISWSYQGPERLARKAFLEGLKNRPKGLYRLKGFVLTHEGSFEVHVVGQGIDLRRSALSDNDRRDDAGGDDAGGDDAGGAGDNGGPTRLVGIALKSQTSIAAIERWWKDIIELSRENTRGHCL